VSINLYSSSHYGGAVTPLLRQLFADADAVLIEQAFQDEGDLILSMLNELSKGNLLIEDVQNVISGIGDHVPPSRRSVARPLFPRVGIAKPIEEITRSTCFVRENLTGSVERADELKPLVSKTMTLTDLPRLKGLDS